MQLLEGKDILTGKTAEFRETIRLRPVPRDRNSPGPSKLYGNKLFQILWATETYYIRNNIEYMNLRTAAGEKILDRSGHL